LVLGITQNLSSLLEYTSRRICDTARFGGNNR